MSGKIKVIGIFVILLMAVTSVSAYTRPTSLKAPQKSSAVQGQYCVVLVEPVARGEIFSQTIDMGCYKTEAEADAAAPMAETVIGKSYNWKFRDPIGGMVTWKASDGHGCSDGSTYSVNLATANDGKWNNWVSSSSAGKGGCGKFLYTEHSGGGGLQLDCGPTHCGTMGSLHNKASRIEWGP